VLPLYAEQRFRKSRWARILLVQAQNSTGFARTRRRAPRSLGRGRAGLVARPVGTYVISKTVLGVRQTECKARIGTRRLHRINLNRERAVG
jgi:hypothetical protein